MSPPDRAEEFVFLLARHERLLGAYVMTMVPHPQDADDILQEAKVVMWRNFAKFEAGTNFGGWARKVAFHQVLAYRKRKQRERVLRECVAKLPADHREALQLRYQEGLSLEDMAVRLERTVGALYRLL